MNKILGPVLVAALAAASAPAIAVPAPAPPAPAPALNPASIAVARQILTIAFPPEKREKMFTSVMNAMVDQSLQALRSSDLVKDKDFEALIARQSRRMYDEMNPTVDAALPDYFESFARAYARDFSLDDLNAILAFVKTPTGQRYFERAPQLMQDPDVQASTQRMMTKILAKAPEIIRENRAEIEDYVAKHKQQKAAEPTPVS